MTPRTRIPIREYHLGFSGAVHVVPEDGAPAVGVGDRVEAHMWHRGRSVCIEGAVVDVQWFGILIWQGAPLKNTLAKLRTKRREITWPLKSP